MDEVERQRQVDVARGGQVVCFADVSALDDGDESPKVSLHSESGHIPPGSRGELVDKVLALPEVQRSARLAVSVPRGDAESLSRLQERCDHINTHMAGATVIVDADLSPGDNASD